MHLGARGFVHPELIDPETGAAARARRRRARASSCSPTCATAAAPLLRFRTRDHVVVRTSPCPLRPHRAARPLHRPHRRHADRARRQRLPVGRARGGQRRSRRGSAATSWCARAAPGVKQEPPLPVSVELARDASPDAALADAIRERLRERARRADAASSSCRGAACSAASTSRSSSSTDTGESDAEAPEPGRPPHHDRRRRPADVDRLLGGRARHALRLRAAQPRQRGGEPPLLRPGRRPADHDLHERGARRPTRRARPTDPGCVHHLAFSLSQATFARRWSGSTSAGSATAA